MAGVLSEKARDLVVSSRDRYKRLEYQARGKLGSLNWTNRRIWVTVVLSLTTLGLIISGVIFTQASDLVLGLASGDGDLGKNVIATPRERVLAMKAQNSTLGFGGIAYLSMPYRTDRQDALELLGSVYNLNFTYIAGVDGNEIPEKSKPLHYYWLRPPELGCWRAHVDAWRHLLESDFETLLVLEDDVDFDANVHDIFELLSIQMQNNKLRTEKSTKHEARTAPYGLDWDVLYVGQCTDQANENRLDLVQIYDDPNVPSRAQTYNHFTGMLETFGVRKGNVGKKRTISPTWSPVCTMGYAITRKGAERLILDLSYRGITAAIDIDIIRKLKQGIIRGYSITPPLFSAWRVGGAKDSDNQGLEKDQTKLGLGNLHGYSLSLKTSARKDMVSRLALNNWDDVDRVFAARPNPQPTKEMLEEEEEEIRKAEIERQEKDAEWNATKLEMGRVMEEWGG
ncbi:hypothetical protein V1514DRAFT_327369 [Lipomyces japonicus]|uniref:uncharacterized protein n=1 Tax=Lipomyces japonicus TaxID=56871 RepID=UPI0034CD56F6